MPLELDYSNLLGHESMLRDSVRCKAFQKAIAETVTPGCVVLDIGAGTGILSLFAAQAGARAVYAVERMSIAKIAEQIVAENGFADRIHVLQGDMEVLELPEKVDVIVSEWLGGYGVDENLLPIVVQARDRWLKPGGTLIPGTVTSWMVPAFDELLQQDVDLWSSEPYGIDLNVIREAVAQRLDCGCNHVREKHILCESQLMWVIDSMTYSLEDANQSFDCRLKFTANRDGEFNALAAWFRAELSDQVVLCNGPSDPDTHWGRSVFPVGSIVSVKKGMPVDVQFGLKPEGKGRSKATWTIEADGYRFSAEGVTVLTEQKATKGAACLEGR